MYHGMIFKKSVIIHLFLPVLFLLLNPDTSMAQWDFFRAEKFHTISDSSDIYKTIEDKFGKAKREKVQKLLTQNVYQNYFREYLEGKTAEETVELVEKAQKQIDKILRTVNSYEAKIVTEKGTNFVGDTITKYFLSFESSFEKTIIELELGIYLFNIFNKEREGYLGIEKRDIKIQSDQTIKIPINGEKLLKETNKREDFIYQIQIDRIGFSDFTYYDLSDYSLGLNFMNREHLNKVPKAYKFTN